MKKSHNMFFGSTIFRRALAFTGILIALQVSIIAFISRYSQYSLIRQAEMNTEYVLHLCEDSLNSETAVADKTLKYLQTQDAYLRLLNSPRPIVAYHAAYELNRIIEASAFADNQGITYIMADGAGQLLVQHRSAEFTYSSLKAMESKFSEIGCHGRHGLRLASGPGGAGLVSGALLYQRGHHHHGSSGYLPSMVSPA